MKICRKNPGLDPDSATAWILIYSAKYVVPEPLFSESGDEILVLIVLKPAEEDIRVLPADVDRHFSLQRQFHSNSRSRYCAVPYLPYLNNV